MVNADIVIRPDPEYRARILAEQRSRMGSGQRREGIHVSDLVFCVRKAWAEKQLGFVEEVPDETILLWVRGLSHEDLLSNGPDQIRGGYCFRCHKMLPWDSRLQDNGAHCLDCGESLLVGTIDWVNFETDLTAFAPVEMKSTLKSARKTLDDMPWYADQLKTYMALHGQALGRIAILHVMGDYARGNPDIRGNGPKPELKTYEITWRDPSAAKNWLAEMEERKEWLEGPDMPPLDSRSPVHPYICDYCSVGESLPDGTTCARWPWVKQPSGVYTRKGSKVVDMNMDDMQKELEALMMGGTTDATD